MIGWHWTARANWESIQLTGEMHEYPLKKFDEYEWAQDLKTGIFAFREGPLDDLDEIGCVLFQSMSKRSLQVVLLHITYNEIDTRGESCRLWHNGALGWPGNEWVYHEEKEIIALRGPIPLERVELIKEYDLRNLTNSLACV